MKCEYVELFQQLQDLRNQHSEYVLDPSLVQRAIDQACKPKTEAILEQIRDNPKPITDKFKAEIDYKPNRSLCDVVDSYIGYEFITMGLREAIRIHSYKKPRNFIILFDIMSGATYTGLRVMSAAGELRQSDNEIALSISRFSKKQNISDSAQIYLKAMKAINNNHNRFQEDGSGFYVLDDFLEEISPGGKIRSVKPAIPELFLAGAQSYTKLYKEVFPLVANIPTLQ